MLVLILQRMNNINLHAPKQIESYTDVFVSRSFFLIMGDNRDIFPKNTFSYAVSLKV